MLSLKILVFTIYNCLICFWMQAPWTSCPFTYIHPMRLSCGILQPIATQDPPFIPANWWHPCYTVPAWLVPFANWTICIYVLQHFEPLETGGAVSSWHHRWLCSWTLELVQGGVQPPKPEERRYDRSAWAMFYLWLCFRFCFEHLPGNGYQGKIVPFSSLIDL